MDELEALARTQQEYRESSIMCFTETWLHEQIPDSHARGPLLPKQQTLGYQRLEGLTQ